jgi:hypothetical protein
VELKIDAVKDVDDLHSFLNYLKSTHPKLQRLSWIFNGRHLTLDELFRQLVRVPELLSALTSYTLGWNDNILFPQNFYWPNCMDDMEETANILLNLSANSNSGNNDSCLQITLSMDLDCECYPVPVRRDCMQCYLQQFIRNHNIPIQIPSKVDNLRMRKNYETDHRFAHCRICK